MVDTEHQAISRLARSAVQLALAFQALAWADLGNPAWLALVAEGVGGGPAGGHAADLAVEAMLAHLAGPALAAGVTTAWWLGGR